MAETTTVMPTSEQLDAFRLAIRAAYTHRGAPVAHGWPTRGIALDAIEAAWSSDHQLYDLDAAMAVIDRDYQLLSPTNQAWLRHELDAALLDLS